jgi:glycosyltransferase involved in cell wall biosynthesis
MIEEISDSPLLSVFMTTYNHEKYISEAIESVLMQKTTFQIELVIGEDCSTDRTRKICINYKEKYPKIIHLILPESNLGMITNGINTFRECKGKYVAILEGDDYWTDPNKLQKQVDFLEANADYSICCHRSLSLINESKSFKLLPKQGKSESTFEDLLEFNFILTLTSVFRNYKLKGMLDVFFKKGNDYSLHLSNAQYGKIKYMDDVMSVYRLHSGGVWSSRNLIERTKNAINDLHELEFEIDPKYSKHIRKNILYFESFLSKTELITAKQLSIKNLYGTIRFYILRIWLIRFNLKFNIFNWK